MSQTATSSSTVAGKLAEKNLDSIVLAIPGSDYRLKLAIENELSAQVGQKITGTIHARAMRVDVVKSGGRYVEPVFGRPRRVQGRIIGGDVSANTIHVKAGPTLICSLTDTRQKAANFAIGQMVSFDIEPGAVFVPEG